MADFLCAWSGQELVGTTEVMPWGQFFGGRSVPMGAVASVAVRPDQRGRGIAPRLLARSVERMHEQGLVISTLHPATTRFYRGLGWEIGGEFGVRRVPTASLAALPPGEPECLRPGREPDFDAVRECYERVAPSINGAVDRDDVRWRADRTALGRPHRYLYVYDADDQIDGYVVYDQHQTRSQWGFGITVHELVAADARAAVTLWRHVGSHVAQVDKVTVLAMPLDVLTLLLSEQVVELVTANHWMTRIVDAAGAVAARGYPPDVRAEVHLQLADRLAPWNDGRFVLRVEGGEGKLSPGGTGDVHLSVNASGVALHGLDHSTLARRGRARAPRRFARAHRPGRRLRRSSSLSVRQLLSADVQCQHCEVVVELEVARELGHDPRAPAVR